MEKKAVDETLQRVQDLIRRGQDTSRSAEARSSAYQCAINELEFLARKCQFPTLAKGWRDQAEAIRVQMKLSGSIPPLPPPDDSGALSGPSQTTEIDEPPIDIDYPRFPTSKDVIVQQHVMSKFLTPFLLRKRQPHLAEGGRLARTVMLYGPPGTGKTMLVNAVAADQNSKLEPGLEHEQGLGVMHVTPDKVYNSLLGESEKVVARIFEYLEKHKKPLVAFFDEADAFFGQRSKNDADSTARVKSMFLTSFNAFLNGSNTNVVVVCATNYRNDFDEAFSRRFALHIEIPKPDAACRRRLFVRLLADVGASATDRELDDLVEKTMGESASNIVNRVKEGQQDHIVTLVDKTFVKDDDGKYIVADAGASAALEWIEVPEGEMSDKVGNPRPEDILALFGVTRQTLPSLCAEKDMTCVSANTVPG